MLNFEFRYGMLQPCPNDAYLEELDSTKTSCFSTR